MSDLIKDCSDCPDSRSRAESELVSVLLHITFEPESAYERFNALAAYVLLFIQRFTLVVVPIWYHEEAVWLSSQLVGLAIPRFQL